MNLPVMHIANPFTTSNIIEMSTEYRWIPNCYMMWDKHNVRSAIIMAPDRDIAEEMTLHYYGEKALCKLVYSDTDKPILKNVEELLARGITQGYITDNGETVIYKRRIEIINDFLAEN